MPTPDIYNLRNTVQAMKSAGLSDEVIVDRVTKRENIDPKLKEIFLQSKTAGIQSKAVNDFLTHPGFQSQTPEMETPGFLGKAARFVGVEPLGRFLGAQVAKLSPEHRKLLSELPEEERQRVSTGDVSGRELAGSVIQTGLSLATPFLGKALTAGTLGSRAVSSAALGGAFGGAGALQEEKADVLTGVLTGALLGGAIPVAGAALKGTFRLVSKLPEKLYAQVFKKAEEDVAAFFKTEALQQMQKTNPTGFAELVNKGIVRIGASGAIETNPTLARELLDRGLRGTSGNMAKYSYLKQLELENTVRSLARGQKISIPNKRGYEKILSDLVKKFQKEGAGFFSQRVQEGQSLLRQLRSSSGSKVKAETVLSLRRFIDDMRNTSSFRLDPSLTTKQEVLKTAADTLRGKLKSNIPGFSEAMNDYRIFIEAFDNIVEDAVRRGNRNLLGLTDILLGGGGMATGVPGGGLGAAAAVRGFQQPFSLTNIGYGVERGLIQPGRRLAEKVLSPGARAVGRTLTGESIAGSQ